MKCPLCGGLTSKVLDTRTNHVNTVIRRRRICGVCDSRYSTVEVTDLELDPSQKRKLKLINDLENVSDQVEKIILEVKA